MKKIALSALLAALAACSSEPEQPAEQPTVHTVMLNRIDKHADELWELTNDSIGDGGGLDPAKMDDAKWAELSRLAGEVAGGAAQLGALDPIKVALPGVKIADEGVPGGDSAASVQANLDRNPELFRQMAGALEAHMRDLAAAAKSHDAAKAGPLVDQLDGVCETCHLDFWYPAQKALVEEFKDSGVTEGK